MSKIRIKTTRELICEPVSAKPDEPGVVNSVLSESGERFPAQCADGIVSAVVSLPAGEHILTTSADKTDAECKITQSGDALDITIGGEKFTSYVYTDSLKKPYLGPVETGFGESYTRLDFETREHPHHRSVFFGVGDVTVAGAGERVDFWNEPVNCGIQLHDGIENIVCGAASASFTAKTKWCSSDGAPMISAACKYTFYSQPECCRYIDLDMTYTADYGDVIFGVTKEAGPLGVRVADPLRVERGGYMQNSYGAKGESECWGRSANWCVYGGELSGNPVGIAVFDNSKNERYPTAWHIRNYGLFAANNLYFKGGLTIPAGKSLTYKYRLVFFRGTPDTARIRDRYIVYCE